LVDHNKLVRDKIPDIIKNSGRKAKYHILSEAEYLAALDEKLLEEVNEYQADKSLEEMLMFWKFCMQFAKHGDTA